MRCTSKGSFVLLLLPLLGLTLAVGACGADRLPEESSEESSVNEKTLFVGPTLVDCEGETPQKCMLVKEDPEADYMLFYDTIEGFVHEEGYEYVLRVEQEQVPNPPADASSLRWKLIEVVEKRPVE